MLPSRATLLLSAPRPSPDLSRDIAIDEQLALLAVPSSPLPFTRQPPPRAPLPPAPAPPASAVGEASRAEATMLNDKAEAGLASGDNEAAYENARLALEALARVALPPDAPHLATSVHRTPSRRSRG